MSSDFSLEVEKIIGPLLEKRGLVMDEVDNSPDSGGGERHIVYFASVDCKVQVYQSSREGEINCMIAPLEVPNKFGPTAEKWQLFTRYERRPDLPFKDLLQAARDEYNSYQNPVCWVRDCIDRNFELAREAVVGH